MNWLEEALTCPAEWAVFPADAGPQMHAAVLGCLYENRGRARALAALAERYAAQQQDDTAQAWADRIAGHIRHVSGEYRAAAEAYSRASIAFEKAGEPREVGRTLLSGIQSLIYCGDYVRAGQWAAEAEAIFTACGDPLRLARLHSNVGNIFYRQDRHQEALARYQRALEAFRSLGEPRDIAAALSNIATCRITLGDFDAAHDTYRQASEHCRRHGLANLTARADYNIAYLHYLRGDYREAFEIYQQSRDLSRQSGDAYHEALADLDQAEMSLELNLSAEGLALSTRAMASFAIQGLRYEEAKAAVNVAVGASQTGDLQAAARALLRARRLFHAEENRLWVALVDQLRAVVAFRRERYGLARRLGQAAWQALRDCTVPGRAALCQILLARLWLKKGDPAQAVAIARRLSKLSPEPSPALRFHQSLLEGEIAEVSGQPETAAAHYQAARAEIERMRDRLEAEDLRISLLADKLAVYEALVHLKLAGGEVEAALALVQEAKSRNLADRLSQQAGEHRALRGEWNWLHRQMELASSSGRLGALQARAAAVSARLERTPASVPAAFDTKPHCCRQALQPGETIAEYFDIRGHLHAFVIQAGQVQAVPLAPTAAVYRALKFLQFQLGKYRWASREELAGDRHLAPVLGHLAELRQLLLAPLEPLLTGTRHLIVAPHRGLHELPFAALSCRSLSIIPSASVFARNRLRLLPDNAGALVLAVPDEKAPNIAAEAALVHAAIPGSQLVLGAEASLDAFRRLAPGKRLVHLASHGIHRADNPLLSALELADGRLSLFDLQHLELNIGLVTLSACNSGMAAGMAGDELIGLMRGFLLAGVRTLVASLWEVDDTSTREFMRDFYQGLAAGDTAAAAMHQAITQARGRHPHPYYWAPFLLVGDPNTRVPS